MGAEFVINSLEEMCDLMCGNIVPGTKKEKGMKQVIGKCFRCGKQIEKGYTLCRSCVEKLEAEYAEQEPCDDAISRQAAIETIINMCKHYTPTKSVYHPHMDFVIEELKELPSVNPQPKTGHWVEENINECSRKVFCSECGCLPPFEHVSNGDVYSASGYGVTNKTKYCPNCGARMEEQE